MKRNSKQKILRFNEVEDRERAEHAKYMAFR